MGIQAKTKKYYSLYILFSIYEEKWYTYIFFFPIDDTIDKELTLKTSSKAAADYFLTFIFQRKQGLTFHVNCLLADNSHDSHDIPNYFFQKKKKKIKKE